jgi:chemotaxis methyl-accepting protein methylase
MTEDVHQLEDITQLHDQEYFGQFLTDHPDVAALPKEEQWTQFRRFGINTQTYFFRDEQVLDAFKDVVLPSYPKAKQLQIASVGCSRGQEVYSLLLSNWHNRQRLHVDGFDINLHNIETALAGEYEVWDDDFYGEGKLFRELDLVKSDEAYKMVSTKKRDEKKVIFSPEAKALTHFSVHDILESPLPSTYDIVLLENVLMHYPEKGREHILKNIYKSLHNRGWLLCEQAAVMDHEKERVNYMLWMRNIGRLGSAKQKIVLPDYFMDDQTQYSQIYRKVQEVSPIK